ncbi:MAG: Gfo/Idh/MocA family protein [Rhodothermales bacterium]
MTKHFHSRRTFLGTMAKAGAVAATAPLIVPRRVLGGSGYQAPSDTVNVAAVGIGGMGKENLKHITGHNIVALCDVDWDFAAPVFEAYPEAARYVDYRRMFDERGEEIDGVVIATPDHTHALITLAAMERGLHVYTQKPLTWSIWEARQLQKAAKRYDVVTQMGNQGRSSDGMRLLKEHIKAGTIGEVREVHIWTNRPIWPQGIKMPEILKRKPEELDWDLWLGPAPEIAYDPAFHPFAWRGWVPFGTGAQGDILPHEMAYPYWALDLGAPVTVETRSTDFNGDSYPAASMTSYDFPAGGNRPPVRISWYDGGLKPATPEGWPEDQPLRPGGTLYVGSKGMYLDDKEPQFISNGSGNPLPEVPRLFERIAGESHEMNWVRAIQGLEEATSPFSFAGPLTEAFLLGIVSMRAGNRMIHWDSENMQVTNLPEANRYLRRQDPREGWELPAIT